MMYYIKTRSASEFDTFIIKYKTELVLPCEKFVWLVGDLLFALRRESDLQRNTFEIQ